MIMHKRIIERNTYRRKVLFLYPSIEEFTDNNIREKVENLIDSLYYIIRDVNNTVARIFSSDIFVNSKYIPVIESQAINREYTDVSNGDIHGLRLCVTAFDKCDLVDKYSKFICKQELEANDISHLLSIKLHTGSRTSVWKKQ